VEHFEDDLFDWSVSE